MKELDANTMKSWKEDLAKPDGTLMPIIALLTHEFFPILTHLLSFENFNFEDESLSLEAYEAVFHFLLTFEQVQLLMRLAADSFKAPPAYLSQAQS